MKNKFIDLIDFEKVNVLLEGFNKTTGFVSAILDLEGNILSKSGWRQICAEFYRVHPATAKNCTICDTELAGKLEEGEKYHFYNCLNGLVDVAVPVVINGEYIANLYSGQFFFEKPNREYFIEQAEKYNFDTEKYLDALDKVPVVSEENVKNALDFLLNMVQLISEIGAQKLEQVELNNELKKSEERFRLLYHNSPDMYVSVSPDDATILLCNDTLLKETGYLREEVIGSSIFNMYHNDCMEDAKETFEQFTKNGKVKNRELILKRKDGSKIDVSLNVYGIKDENGKTLYSLSSWRDITEHKLVEIELARAKENVEISENYLDSIINNIGEPVFVKDDKSRLILVNDAFCSMFNLSRDQIIGKTLAVDVSEKERESFLRIDNQVLTTGIENNMEESLTVRGEKTKIITTKKTRYIDNNGKKYLVGIIHDITEQKEAIEALIESEERFALAMNAAKEGLYDWNLITNEVYYSPAWKSMLGYEYTELPNDLTVWGKLTHPDDAKKVQILNEEVINKKLNRVEVEFRMQHKNGLWLDILSQANVLFNENGKAIRMIGTHLDITDRKLAEQAMIESEERFSSIFKKSPVPAAIRRLSDSKFIEVNEAWCNFTEFSRDEAIGRTITELNIIDDEINKKQRDAFSPYSKLKNIETVIRTKKGKKKYLLTYIETLTFGGEKYALNMAIDITERKQIEVKIKESEERFNLAVNGSKDGIWDWYNLESDEYWWSNRLYEILGYQPGEVEARVSNWKKWMHPDDSEMVLEVLKKHLEENLPYQVEFRMQKKGGDYIWIAARGESVRNSNGLPTRMAGSFSDITDRKLAELGLEKRNEYVEKIMANMPIGFAVNTIDDGKAKYMNNRFEEIYGWPRDVLTDTHNFFEKIFPDSEFREKMKSQIYADMQSGDPERMNWKDVQIVTKSGEERFVYALNIPLIDQNLMISTVQDTTERKLAEDEIMKHKNHLEELVTERTLELESKYADIELMNKMFVGRELRMVELKTHIIELEEKLKNKT